MSFPRFSIESRQSKSPKMLAGHIFQRPVLLGRNGVDPHHRKKSFRLVKARRETIFYSGLRVLTQFPKQL
jgi:hypothetical protein